MKKSEILKKLDKHLDEIGKEIYDEYGEVHSEYDVGRYEGFAEAIQIIIDSKLK